MRDYLKPYILRLTFWVNIVFLIWHMVLFGIFGFTKVWILAGFNVFSICIYINTLFSLKNGRTHGVIRMMYVELLLHMLFSVICVGWDCGFQEYAFGIIPIIMFGDYINDTKLLKWSSLMMAASVVISYLGLAVWSGAHAPLYTFGTEAETKLFGIINGSVTVLAVSVYFLIFTRMVMGFERGLMHDASYDTLTGLGNRRMLYDRMEKVTKDTDYLVCMFDVDNFKTINDTFGHDVGDRVLEAIGSILTENKYQLKDFLPVRWGGEEFVVIYSDKALGCEEKIRRMEEIRNRISTVRIPTRGQEITFTSTAGAAYSAEAETIDELVVLADSRMYYGKKHGKNCLVFAHDEWRKNENR